MPDVLFRTRWNFHSRNRGFEVWRARLDPDIQFATLTFIDHSVHGLPRVCRARFSRFWTDKLAKLVLDLRAL